MKNIAKPIVLVTREVYNKGQQVYGQIEDLEIVVVSENEDSIAEMAKEKNAYAVILGGEKYTSKLYQILKQGSLIVRFGVGYDGIDLKKASVNGLIVTNTPGVLESTVAEFTLLLAGEAMRYIGFINQNMKNGHWNPILGYDLRGKTWAIIGLGRIGKQLSRILSFGFGVHVVAFNKLKPDTEKLSKECGVEKISSEFSQIIPYADIVSLHLPANSNNYHFLDGERLKLFKKGAILINTARGSLIDENALYDLLENGHLAFAGLDVFENEPYSPVDPNKDLRKLPNVVLTPHIASSTIECSNRIAERTIQNIRFAIEGKFELMDIVNKD